METQELQKQVDYRNFIRQYYPCQRSEVNMRVRGFMFSGNQPVNDYPRDPGEDVRKLAANLILEEAVETINALGFDVKELESTGEVGVTEGDFQFDLEEASDGCLDTIYVCHWALNAMGVADELPMLEVCDANDRKVGPGSSMNDAGKIVKPAGWTGAGYQWFVRRSEASGERLWQSVN